MTGIIHALTEAPETRSEVVSSGMNVPPTGGSLNVSVQISTNVIFVDASMTICSQSGFG